ncbi:hypothetical protein, partial [Burkholderia anthina]|uniref:hypothetical protein n=1 Tax=Burkholderia anthina TaxID=179879 RepID=UPI001C8AF2CB
EEVTTGSVLLCAIRREVAQISNAFDMSDKGDVEASLKRLRGAAGATCREAGWIAEARPHYFMEISKSFQNV